MLFVAFEFREIESVAWSLLTPLVNEHIINPFDVIRGFSKFGFQLVLGTLEFIEVEGWTHLRKG